MSQYRLKPDQLGHWHSKDVPSDADAQPGRVTKPVVFSSIAVVLVVCIIVVMTFSHRSRLAASVPVAVAAAPVERGGVPEPAREFRGVWVATVANIDWPSKRGLPAAQQRAELIAILNRAVETKLNAVVLQVRPACDAFYPSSLEPWSHYLTGKMGSPPNPPYDPLAFAIREAHNRGLELHAWFNPYRAFLTKSDAEVSPDHISVTHPEIVRKYGDFLWLDPGEKATQDHSVAVIMDVVKRYDVDGIHFDDYFYPYKVKDDQGRIVDFPDDAPWDRYVKAGGTLGRDDWRRENVNGFVRRLYQSIHKGKPWVRFGISPFGIWRPGNPPQIQGLDAYASLYADSRKWLQEGWVDYFTPQLYWREQQVAQSYPVLLKWWVEQNTKHRNLWPGLIPSRIGTGTPEWKAQDIIDQVRSTRAQQGATGNIHFSMKPLMQNRGAILDRLKISVYAQPALPPSNPWIRSTAPSKPSLRYEKNQGSIRLSWTQAGKSKPWLWLLQTKSGDQWATQVLPTWQRTLSVSVSDSGPDTIALTAVDRLGNLSAPALANRKK